MLLARGVRTELVPFENHRRQAGGRTAGGSAADAGALSPNSVQVPSWHLRNELSVIRPGKGRLTSSGRDRVKAGPNSFCYVMDMADLTPHETENLDGSTDGVAFISCIPSLWLDRCTPSYGCWQFQERAS